jgi:hypothetical protein
MVVHDKGSCGGRVKFQPLGPEDGKSQKVTRGILLWTKSFP